MLLTAIGPAAEAPLEAVPRPHGRIAGRPGEYDLTAADGTGRHGAQRDRLGGGGGLGAPDHGVERDGEDQADGQPAGVRSSTKKRVWVGWPSRLTWKASMTLAKPG